jgi:hypothetical protein
MKKLERIAVNCDFCGDNLLVPPCLMKRNKRHFCGVECHNEWHREHAFGELSPRWSGGKVIVKCSQCGVEIFRKKSEIKEHKNHFCSRNCDGKWRSENKRGAAIYNFNGGIIATRERRKRNVKERLNSRMRTMVRHSLKGKKNGYSWERLVGYSSDDLRSHLTKTMPAGREWADFMAGDLEIDHILPICRFNFSEAGHIDFKRCWSMGNLRLLDKAENRQKHAKLYHSFQPSLALEVSG